MVRLESGRIDTRVGLCSTTTIAKPSSLDVAARHESCEVGGLTATLTLRDDRSTLITTMPSMALMKANSTSGLERSSHSNDSSNDSNDSSNDSKAYKILGIGGIPEVARTYIGSLTNGVASSASSPTIGMTAPMISGAPGRGLFRINLVPARKATQPLRAKSEEMKVVRPME